MSFLVISADDFIFALKQMDYSSAKRAAAVHTEVSFEMKIKAAYAATGLTAHGIFMISRRLSLIRQYGG